MKEKVKIAYIGLGRRGVSVLRECFAKMSDVEITVLCDTYEPALNTGAEILENAGKERAILTTDADAAINNPDVDAVVIMTGWNERAVLAEKAMLAGKYTAIEVGCAFDISECYRLIDVYEQTKSPLMMLENCCYGRREMMGLRLVKEGLFGEVVHCAGGYHHFLPDCELFLDIDKEYKHYRLASYVHRNCEQYPTHELGPISKVLNINRGNRFMTLSSFASGKGGLKQSAKTILGEDSPYAKIDYKQSDIITTILTCANGQTVHLCLDTTSPRPYYSRNFTVRGTKGMCTEERKVVFLEGMEEPVENNEEQMYEKYDHPLHKEYHELGERGGHDGMDWLVCRAFVESVKNGTNTPIDAYDTVTWMAIAALSEASINQGGAPVTFPDFTKGKWINREAPLKTKYTLDEIVEDRSVPIFLD
ncbi:MAG: Gfo/Idh/MocA family oxidoreductase [Clostridia bacterium]|nr:Gfo/Idh/MocA family oxidoreductase [Clostridia bacterium]